MKHKSRNSPAFGTHEEQKNGTVYTDSVSCFRIVFPDFLKNRVAERGLEEVTLFAKL